MPAPAEWDWVRIQSALTERLTEATIADIVIRVSLIVSWIAFATFVATVFAELGHMARHQGLPMPDIRGFAIPQQFARFIAAGLLVVVPLVGSASRATASDTTMLVPAAWQTTSAVVMSSAPTSTSTTLCRRRCPSESTLRIVWPGP